MVLKIFRGVWFISMMAVFANLMYIYAYLPQQVALFEEELRIISTDREVFFYVAMAAIALINVLVYLFSKKVTPDEHFRIWVNGLVIVLNIFFIISMSFIGVYNSTEKFNFADIGFVIYGSVGLFVAWVAAWPVYSVFRKLSAKQSV